MNQVLLNIYLVNFKSWEKITIEHFQSHLILTIKFILKEEPILVLVKLKSSVVKQILTCNQCTIITRQFCIGQPIFQSQNPKLQRYLNRQ